MTSFDEIPHGCHVFVDETMRSGIALVAALIVPGDLAGLRSAMRSCRLPGQSHIRFTKESPKRRKALLSQISAMPVHALIYHAEKGGRYRCLRRLVADAQTLEVSRLILEKDESLQEQDRREIRSYLAATPGVPTFQYLHEAKRAEPMLWIADAIAWSWPQREWRPRIASLVAGVADCDEAQ